MSAAIFGGYEFPGVDPDDPRNYDANPIVDQYLRAAEGFSSLKATALSEERKACVIEIPLVAGIVERFHGQGVHRYEGMPWPREYSNSGRGLMPNGGYGASSLWEADLRWAIQNAEDQGSHETQSEIRGRLALADEEYLAAVVAVADSAMPLQTVVLLCPRQGNRSYDVTPGWTQMRLGTLAALRTPVPDCYGCGHTASCAHASADSKKASFYLHIPCGGMELVAGLCYDCEEEVRHAVADSPFPIWPRMTFPEDRWYSSVGWPDERWW